jgi:hypothetical protein
MGIFTSALPAAKFGVRTGWSWTSKIKFLLMSIFFAVLLINAVIISIQAHSIEPGLKDIGGRLLFTTENLNTESLKIISNGGVFPNTGEFFKDIWIMFIILSGLLTSIFIIYIWLKLFSFVAKHMIIFDDSKTAVSYIIATGIFFGLQVALIVFFTDKSPTIPFIAFSNFIKAIPFAFSPMAKIADKISGTEGFNETINNISNTTNITNETL